MSICRILAAAIVGLAMSAGMIGTSHADSDGAPWWRAYDSGDQSNRYFKRGNVTCDRSRDVCYDRYGLSYQATARYLGEREANRAYRKYGKQVFLFSPKRGVVCDRRTETCTNKRLANGNYGDPFNRSTQAREGFGAIGSGPDWQREQQQPYWRLNNDD